MWLVALVWPVIKLWRSKGGESPAEEKYSLGRMVERLERRKKKGDCKKNIKKLKKDWRKCPALIRLVLLRILFIECTDVTGQ